MHMSLCDYVIHTYIASVTRLGWHVCAHQNSSHRHPSFIPIRKIRFILIVFPLLVPLDPPRDDYTDPELLKWRKKPMPDLCTQHTAVIFDVRLGQSQLGSLLRYSTQPTK